MRSAYILCGDINEAVEDRNCYQPSVFEVNMFISFTIIFVNRRVAISHSRGQEHISFNLISV